MRTRCVLLWMAFAVVATAGSVCIHGETIIQLPGLDADSRLLPRLMMWAAVDEEAALRLSDEMLRDSPKNPGVLFFRSNLLLRLGRVAEATAAVKLLKEAKPRWILGWQVEVELLEVRGENPKAADLLEGLLREEFSDPMEASDARVMARTAPARIAELRGKIDEAESAWKARVEDKRNGDALKSALLVELGRFYLRQGQDAKAERTISLGLETGGKDKGEDSKLDALLELVNALWVQGKLDQAVKHANVLLVICEGKSLDSEPRLQALLTSYMVGKLGDDKATVARAEALLGKAASMDIIAKRISGLAPLVRDGWKGRETKAVADQTRALLKQAPRLEWARWTALYLALDGAADYEGILKSLPDDCIQNRIFRQMKQRARPQSTSAKVAAAG